MSTRICPICLKEFASNIPHKKYCSTKCYTQNHCSMSKQLAKNNRQRKNKICPVCQKEFIKKAKNQKYCSKKCFTEHHIESQKQYKINHKNPPINKIYPVCQKKFISYCGIQTYCSIRCRQNYFKILRVIRTRIYRALKYHYKSARTLELLGCTIDECWMHLEKQFKHGMTKENHGLWHIDHIKPCCSFDLSDPEQQKQCFHYTNLQPLWADENTHKGKKVLTKKLTE